MSGFIRRIVAVTTLSLMVFSLSACDFFVDNSNTKTASQIMEDAEKAFAQSFKEMGETEFKKAATRYFASLSDFASTREGTITMNFNAAEEGKASVTVEYTDKTDKSPLKEIGLDSTVIDLINAISAQSSMKISAVVEAKGQEKMTGSIDFDMMSDKGVFYIKLNEVVAPDNIPGFPASNVDAITSLYKGKWFKLDFNQLIESNPFLNGILRQKIYKLDPEKMSALVDAYVEDVVVKNDLFELDEKMIETSRKGDVYGLTITKKNVRQLIADHYDFAINNFEALDEIFDFTQKNNPLVRTPIIEATPEPTTEEATEGDTSEVSSAVLEATAAPKMVQGIPASYFIEDMKREKEATLREFDDEEFEEITLHGLFKQDRLAAIMFKKEISEDGAVVNIDAGYYFEDTSYHINKSHVKATFDVKDTENDKNHGKGEIFFNAPKSGNRLFGGEMSATFVEPGDEKASDLEMSLNMGIDEEAQKVDHLKAKFELKAGSEIEAGITGVDVAVNYAAGSKNKFSASVKTDPRDRVAISADGKFGRTAGNGKFKANIDFDGSGTAVVTADAEMDYTGNEDAYSFSLPTDAQAAQDLTPAAQMALEQFMTGLMFGLAGGGAPFGSIHEPVNVTDFAPTEEKVPANLDF